MRPYFDGLAEGCAICDSNSSDRSSKDGGMGVGSEHFTRAPAPSLLSKRERFHLAYRLASRSFQLLVARSSRTPQRHMAAAAAFAVGDIVSAVALRRSGRIALGPRLAVDAVAAALWSQGDTGLELATMPGVPLAIEAGLRIGAAGLIVPVMRMPAAAASDRRC